MKARNAVRRGSPFSLPGLGAFAVTLLLVSCAGGPWMPAALPGPERPAERAGPSMTTVALYNPALFGPERPLAQLIREHRLPLVEGKLKNAALLVNKAQRRLELWVRRKMIKAYRVQLGLNARGPKIRRGDKRTPEGRYIVCSHRPSTFYLALWLAYPNLDDARRGLGSGLIKPEEYRAIAKQLATRACPPQNTRLGGDIIIHGQLPELTEEMARAHRADPGSLHPGFRSGDADPAAVREFQDWTNGCVALFNPDIRELYEFVPDGAEVLIVANAAVTAPQKPAPLARRPFCPVSPTPSPEDENITLRNRPPASRWLQVAVSPGRIDDWDRVGPAAVPVPFAGKLSCRTGFPAASLLRLEGRS